MNEKTNAQLREEIFHNETRSEFGAWAVVVGLVIEVILAIAFRSDKSFIENWAPVLADCLIALGVYCEIHFGRRVKTAAEELQRLSDEKIAEAEARAAEANQKAQEAMLKLEQLRKQLGPRRIDSEIFLAELAEQPKAPLEILYSPDDPDSWNLALRTASLLVEAGWLVNSPIPIPRKSDSRGSPSSVMAGGYPSGVTISVSSLEEHDKPGTAYTALWNAFWKGLDTGGMFATRHEEIPEGTLRVIIAPRE
jgi:hypothetical protein